MGVARGNKNCCWKKSFQFVRNTDGVVHRWMPISKELRQEFDDYFDKYREKHGRDIWPDQPIFSATDIEQAEAGIVDAIKRAGIPPEFIYAFEKTGRIATKFNKQFITNIELEEYYDAVLNTKRNMSAESREKNHRYRGVA